MKVKAKTTRTRSANPKASAKPGRSPIPPSANGTTQAGSDVLTLSDAAAFLRVADEDVRKLAEAGSLPGRKVSGNWRFLEAKLREWLSEPESDTEERRRQRINASFGSLADDETAMEMLEKIYEERRKHPVAEIPD